MKSALWKTCIGSVTTAVFCVATCALSFGAEGNSVEEMERELNALKASVANLTEQLETVKQEKTVATTTPADTRTKEDVEALKNEVSTLKEEMRTAAQAEPTLKAEDITGNVYSEFAKRVKLGGQIKTRAEYANGFYQTPTSNGTLPGATTSTGTTPSGLRTRGGSSDDDYVLNQTRLWADADVNEHLRVFIQIQDARTFGAEGTTVGFANVYNENSILDIHQGYFDIRKLFDLPLTVRVGRQEIIWGDHRVIGNFVWSNVGRTFDGGRFMWDTDAIHAEAFAAKVNEGGWSSLGEDPDGNSDENIYAAQIGFKKLIPGALLELMYIQKNQQNNNVNSATATGFDPVGASAPVVIHDFGIRIDGKVPSIDAIDYTFEGHGQVGDYGTLNQRAWAVAARAGYTFKEIAWTPRFGLEYDFASGDSDPNDGDHNTFDNLYPTNHWQNNYGAIDLISWQNMHDARANIKVVPTSKMTAQVDYHYFWLNQTSDGWYLSGAVPAVARPAGGFASDNNNLAQEVDLTVSYSLYKNVQILAGYSFFSPEDWIKDTISDTDTQWGYIQTTVTF